MNSAIRPNRSIRTNLGFPLWCVIGIALTVAFEVKILMVGAETVNGSPMSTQTDEPAQDEPCADAECNREVLIKLYESMGGENWTDNTNWLSDRPVEEWFGLLVYAGKLLRIELSNNGLTGSIPPEIGDLGDLTRLDLDNNAISGIIPKEIGNLANLEWLLISRNEFSGTIPVELGKLTKLKELNLHGNNLTGEIPPELGNLANLQNLLLGENSLSGTIPDSLGNLEKLEWLFLWVNQLSGAIPASLGNLTQLTQFVIAQNEITGSVPPELGNLINLAWLEISYNSLSGQIPQTFVNLPLASFSWLGNSELCIPDSDEMADWINEIEYYTGGAWCHQAARVALDSLYEQANGKDWTNTEGWPDGALDSRYGVTTDADGRVTEIDLANNGLSGELPLALGEVRSLELLRIDRNPDLAGRLPYSLSGLEELRTLSYTGTKLCIPNEEILEQWLENLRTHRSTRIECPVSPDRESLTDIYGDMGGSDWSNRKNWLSDLPLRDWFGVEANAQGRVTSLVLVWNQLTGSMSPGIFALEELTKLHLTGIDEYEGSLPSELGDLKKLTELTISNIYSKGPIPPEIGKLKRLTKLSLTRNELSGPIPVELTALAELQTIDLSNNDLSGPIPEELGELTNLTNINFANNELDGSLPISISQLEELEILDLSVNELSEPLPKELGDLAKLWHLDLSQNDFYGDIPAEFGDLGSMTYLYLGGNSLSGTLPTELSQLPYLRSLVVSRNHELTGELPTEFKDLENLRHLQAIQTGVCAPSDPAVTGWLDTLLTRRVRPCDTEADAFYLTQGIQSLATPIALIAGREAMLRVFPTADRANSERMPAVQADFYLEDELVHTARISRGRSPIPQEINESSLSRSANALIPGDVVQPGLEITIEIDPQSRVSESLNVRRRIPEAGRHKLDVRSMSSFEITLIPYLWRENPDRSVIELIDAIAANPDTHEDFRFVRKLLPVEEIAIEVHAPVEVSTNNTFDLYHQTNLIRTMEGAKNYYMGLIAGEISSGVSGIGEIGGRYAISHTDAWTIAHEFGHNLSMRHSPCGGPGSVDPAYPYPEASPGGWGYDFSERALVSPHEHKDLMAYCGPAWISDFSFDKMFRYRLYSEGRLVREPPVEEQAVVKRSLVIWGGLDVGSKLFLEPAVIADTKTVLPQVPGPYRVTGRDVYGKVLFELQFGMLKAGDTHGQAAFAFAIPIEDEWSTRLSSVTLSGPESSPYTLTRAQELPLTVMRDRQTGEVSGIVRDPDEKRTLRSQTEPGLYSRGIPATNEWLR